MIPFPHDFINFEGEIVDPPKITIARGAANPKGRRVDVELLIAAVKTVFDPDVGIDVYNLGLIYKIDPLKNSDVKVEMTLTSPTCPYAEKMVSDVAQALSDIEGVGKVTVKLVWSPAWDLAMLSDEARYRLDLF